MKRMIRSASSLKQESDGVIYGSAPEANVNGGLIAAGRKYLYEFGNGLSIELTNAKVMFDVNSYETIVSVNAKVRGFDSLYGILYNSLTSNELEDLFRELDSMSEDDAMNYIAEMSMDTSFARRDNM